MSGGHWRGAGAECSTLERKDRRMTFFATPRWLMALLFVLPVSPCLAADGVPDGFTLALGGATLGPYHPLPGPEDTGFNRVADLFRHADMGFANQEGSVLDMTAFSGWPALETGGGYSHQNLVVAHGWREMRAPADGCSGDRGD